MKMPRLLLLLIPLSATLLAGCEMFFESSEARVIDVTAKPAWWGPTLHRNAILVLTQDALLDRKSITLNAPDPSYVYPHVKPNVNVAMYKADPGKEDWKELHLLREGTRLRCERLERYYSYQIREYQISVKILDGAWSGQTVILAPVGGDPDFKGSLTLGSAAAMVRMVPE